MSADPGGERGGDDAAPAAERRGAAPAPPPARSAPRLSFEAVVRLSCAGRRGIHTGFVRDIARGGMFLRLVDPEPVGRRLGFELFLPGWRVPARGVGEVVWQRPSYEGPGRPPGMAIRFVALEARGIEMLAAVLPGGEVPVVEVLEPARLPPVRRDERPAETASPAGDTAAEPVAGEASELSLEALLAESGVSTAAQSSSVGAPLDEGLVDDDGPVIFVPPPPPPWPLPPPEAPALAAGPEVRAFPAREPQPSGLRWGSAAAGIAAMAGLATLVVVGAARRDVLPPPDGPATPAVAVEMPAAAPRETVAVEMSPAPLAIASEPAAGSTVETGARQPASAAAEMRSPAAVLTPATRITGLRWEPLPAGGTRVTIALDGSFATTQRLRASRIGGESPRLVVRLLGLDSGGSLGPWEPATAEVRRIRAGRHDGESGRAIHLVLDIADPAVRLAATAVTGGELRLDLVRSPAAAVR